MNSILYIYEINIICMIVLGLMMRCFNFKTIKNSTNENIFNQMLIFSFFLCVFDMITQFFSKNTLPYTHLILEIFNDLYCMTISMICYQWLHYVYVKIFKHDFKKYQIFLLQVPLFIFFVALLTNHLTRFIFMIDSSNVYHRGPGIYIHWIISWFYIILATFMSFYALLHTKSKYQRKEIHPYLHFIIAPIIASLFQMHYYGATSFQVGITLSLLMIFFSYQNNLIQKDPLTGLKNRHVLEQYFDSLISPFMTPLSFVMIDIDKFKKINDDYGHLVGDQVIQEIALTLQQYCMYHLPKAQVYRYGGDEFLIIHDTLNKEDFEKLRNELNKKIQEIHLSIPLSVSIGYSRGKVYSEETIKKILQEADENMYSFKEKTKKYISL